MARDRAAERMNKVLFWEHFGGRISRTKCRKDGLFVMKNGIVLGSTTEEQPGEGRGRLLQNTTCFTARSDAGSTMTSESQAAEFSLCNPSKRSRCDRKSEECSTQTWPKAPETVSK